MLVCIRGSPSRNKFFRKGKGMKLFNSLFMILLIIMMVFSYIIKDTNGILFYGLLGVINMIFDRCRIG